MGRYTKCNNVVGLAEILEVGRVVAFVAVEDKQPIYPSCTTLGGIIKMF